MRRRKLLLAGLIASALLGLLAACGEAATPTPTTTTAGTDGGAAPTATPIALPTPTPLPTGELPQYGGIYRRTGYTHNNPDPYHFLHTTTVGYTHGMQFNRLIEHKKPNTFGMEVELVPALATEWSVDETETKWTFKLREGVTWHDGEVFDVNDVKTTFERALDPNLLVSGYGITLRSIIDNMEVVDDYTIIIDTSTPNALTIPWLSNWAMVITPDHLIRDSNPGPEDTGWRWMQPRVDDPDLGKGTGTLGIGTGPYIMTNWEPLGLFTNKRNPNYWLFDDFGNRLPYLDGVVDAYTVDRTRQLAEIATGDSMDLRGSAGLSATKAERLCARRTDGCHTDLAEHGFFYDKLNDQIPPFDDPNIREAARWALHVYKTAQVPFEMVGSHGQFMHFLFPEAKLTDAEAYQLAPWLDPDDRTIIPPDKWQDKARERLAELGFPNGVDLQYPWYQSTSAPFRDMQGILSTDLRAGGFAHSIASSSGTNEIQRAGKWNVATSSCGSPLVDPTGGVSMGGLAWSATVGRRPWAWEGVDDITNRYLEANKVTDVIQRGELLKDMERWYLEPTRPFFAEVWTLQFMTIPDCVKNFSFGPGLFGSMEHSHKWMTREGQCFKNYETDLELIEPQNPNIPQSVMWNWQ